MQLVPSDIVGFAGVALVVGAYALSQMGRMETTRPAYPALNALGSGLILFSLVFSFNAASALIETLWLVVSLVGLFRALRAQ